MAGGNTIKEYVNSMKHDDPFNGNEWWNLKNGKGQEVAPGLYIYTVEAGNLEPHIGKFAVVR